MDHISGNLSLVRPLKELITITGGHQPILLTIIAEELKKGLDEPDSMSSTVQVALLLGELGNSPPHFENENYVARIAENSPQGTALLFGDPYITEIRDDDVGQNEVFSITLENNNGTFEVSPTVGKWRTSFVIRVRNNTLLDFEARRALHFTIVAREVESLLNSSALVTVYIDDVNDNPPVFLQPSYEVELPENMTVGVTVTQVKADDVDTGLFSHVRYTQILGYLNTSLTLDSETGLITVATNNHKFDREAAPDFRFYVEARDMEGQGNRATAPLIIKLIDVNDETPKFERPLFEFILASSLRNFTVPAFLKAIDNDAEPPNNIVRYEIINGNYDDRFQLDEETGELTPKPRRNVRRAKRENSESNSVTTLTVRAYDLGIPHRWSVASIRVYPPESGARTMMFIVDGTRPDRESTESMLAVLTGGRVIIQDIQRYSGQQVSNDLSGRENAGDKSVVTATVLYHGSPVVDVSKLQQQFHVEQPAVVERVTEYPPANRALFWVLMILSTLIVIIVLLLLLCCICPGCPLYFRSKKHTRIESEENVHLVLKEQGPGMETKAVQAERSGLRREAWSADQRQRQWRFNTRNNPNKEYIEFVGAMEDRRGGYEVNGAAAAAGGMRGPEERHSPHSVPAHLRVRDGPAVIYSRELQELQQRHVEMARDHHRDVYLEDIEGVDYHSSGQLMEMRETRPPHQMRDRQNVDEDRDTDSMRRHEVERGSDLGRGADFRRAEVNQTVSDGSREYRLVLQRANRVGNEEDEVEVVDETDLSTAAAARREQFYIRDGNAEILRLVTRGRSGGDAQYVSIGNQQTIGTTQQQRPMTLVPSRPQAQQHYIRVDNGKEIIMQRFMEDQRHNSGQQAAVAREQESQQHSLNNGSTTINNLQQQDMLVRRLLEEEEVRLSNMRLLSEALAHHQEQEAQFMATNNEQQETQSLPGQASMATQTDVDNSTQTEPLYLMRPPRRKAKSDNDDDSYTEEEQEGEVAAESQSTRNSVSSRSMSWTKRRKSKRKQYKDPPSRRSGGSVGKGAPVSVTKRHKIKTPIIEETESALEAAERQLANIEDEEGAINDLEGYSETKSSLLRRRNNKVKIQTTAGEVEVTTVLRSRRQPLEEVEEETPSDSLEEKSTRQKSRHSRDEDLRDLRNRTKETDKINLAEVKERWNHEASIDRALDDGILTDKRNVPGEEIGLEPPRNGVASSRTNLSALQRSDAINSRNSQSEWENSLVGLPENHPSYSSEVSSGSSAPRSQPGRSGRSTADITEVGIQGEVNYIDKSERAHQVALTSAIHKGRISRRNAATASDNVRQRQSVSEPGRSAKQAPSTLQNQTIASRAKSLSQVDDEPPPETDKPVDGGTSVKNNNTATAPRRTTPRYMEWYKKKREEREKKKREEEETKKDQLTKKVRKPEVKNKRKEKDTKKDLTQKIVISKPSEGGVFEVESRAPEEKVTDAQHTLKVVAFEDDLDSGIAMSSMLQGGKKRRNHQILEKKSVFTIAYNDMQTKQIRPDSSSPPY